jgi:hypothetical protein
MDPLVIPLVGVVAGTCMIIFLRYYANMERMAMIEKGIAPNDTKKLFPNINGTLKVGLLMVGVGLGVLFGAILGHYHDVPDGVVIAIILISGGASLLVSYYIESKNSRKDESK